MEFHDVLIQNLFGFAAALIGAAVGGIFTLYATDKTIRAENAKERQRGEEEVQNLLDALGVELGALWGFHMRRIGDLLEALGEGQPLEFYYPITQDYFTIYHSNAALIGRVPDPALREAIVTCYNKCKKVVDGFKYNNELYKDYRDLGDSMQHDNPHFAARLEAKRRALADFAQILTEDHYELKSYIERLLEMLGSRSTDS